MTLDASTLSLLAIIALLLLALISMAAGISFLARRDRLPAATRFEDVGERLAIAETTLGRRQDELREVEQKISERDRYGAEAEVLRREVTELKLEKENLAPAREEIEQVKQEAAAAAGELAEKKQALAALQEEIDRRQGDIDPERIARLRQEKEELDAEVARLRGELGPIRAEHDAALRTLAEAGTAQARVEALKIEATRLESEASRLADDLDALRGDADEARSELVQARSELEEAHRAREVAADQRTSLLAQVAALKRELGASAGPAGAITPEERAATLADLTVTPACLGTPDRLRHAPRPEAEALHDVSTYLDRCGLRFSRRTLHAFHTALKINDAAQLTVLAGVSGTGKSLLPRRYAEALGIHFAQVAVEPRWDSPQDLLGFYNYVEKKYRATELARLLAHLDPWRKGIDLPEEAPDRRDHMALVLLDEMNLARVEYYFSEFLSRLEARPAWIKDLDRQRCKDALIPVDIRGLKDAPTLFPAHNILFVGTMNDDESTQSLSDKVLDRGNVLQFPAPTVFPTPQQRQDPPPATEAQRFAEWRGWIGSATALDGTARQSTESTITALAGLMQRFGRPFGHRLNQAIRAYVANYPVEGNAGLDARKPLADQVELRILPRLRGVQIDASRPIFDELCAHVRTALDDGQLARRLEQTVSEQQSGSGLFVWRGLSREAG